jgi:hypothetical protein
VAAKLKTFLLQTAKSLGQESPVLNAVGIRACEDVFDASTKDHIQLPKRYPQASKEETCSKISAMWTKAGLLRRNLS